MRILITGVAGFAGQHLIRYLVNVRSHRLFGLDQKETAIERVPTFSVDITDDINHLASIATVRGALSKKFAKKYAGDRRFRFQKHSQILLTQYADLGSKGVRAQNEYCHSPSVPPGAAY